MVKTFPTHTTYVRMGSLSYYYFLQFVASEVWIVRVIATREPSNAPASNAPMVFHLENRDRLLINDGLARER